MYLLNNRKEEHIEGLTIQKIIEIKRYTYPKKIVKVNDELIDPDDWATTIVQKGDNVQIIHLLAGG